MTFTMALTENYKGRQQQCPRYQFLRYSPLLSREEEGKTHRYELPKNFTGDCTHHIPEEFVF